MLILAAHKDRAGRGGHLEAGQCVGGRARPYCVKYLTHLREISGPVVLPRTVEPLDGLYIGAVSEPSYYPVVAADFARRLALVTPEQWSDATPCEEWTVVDLVTHVVATHRRVYQMAVSDYVAPDVELVAAWDEIHDAFLAALDDPTLAETPVQSFRGEQPFAQLIGGLLTFDTLTHTWDLARAIGADDELNRDAVAYAAKELEPIGDALRVPGGFGPAVTSPPDADPQTRLLNFLGRRP